MRGQRLPQDLKIADNTIVVYSTDNSYELLFSPDGGYSPFRGDKGTTWEGGVRVPIVRRVSFYDEHPMVRLGGVEALAGLPADLQVRLAQHLLDDPVRAVWVETRCALTSVPADAVQATQCNWMNRLAGK